MIVISPKFSSRAEAAHYRKMHVPERRRRMTVERQSFTRIDVPDGQPWEEYDAWVVITKY